MKEILKRHPRYHLARARFEALPDNLWVRCPRCEDMVYAKELESALDVCPKCKYHFAVTARQRIAMTLDEDTFAEYDGQMRSSDPLNFEANGEAYRDKLGGYAEKAGNLKRSCTAPARSRDWTSSSASPNSSSAAARWEQSSVRSWFGPSSLRAGSACRS